ncbi:MAG: NUDIX domain-containing protein [Nanoarchaeota archaeon]
MIKQKSSGAVVFIKDKEIKYLILQYGLGHWDFSRGLVEKDETEEEAALREIKEETNLNVKIISGFKEKTNFFFREKGELISKEVVYFLAKTNNEKVKLSFEHLNYSWLNYNEALEKLTFKNVKEVLKKANNFLNNSLINY